MTSDQLPALVKPKEAAAFFGVCVRTVFRFEEEWGLVRVRVRTRSVFYRKADVVRVAERASVTLRGQ